MPTRESNSPVLTAVVRTHLRTINGDDHGGDMGLMGCWVVCYCVVGTSEANITGGGLGDARGAVLTSINAG
jgi:hypothetical protein